MRKKRGGWTLRRSRLIRRLYNAQGRLCYLCGGPMFWPMSFNQTHAHVATLDHIVAASKGGGNLPPNLALAHKKCNSVKSDSQPKACELLFGRVIGAIMDGDDASLDAIVSGIVPGSLNDRFYPKE
jgi:5-methylcytosine-specific restriction endonuclease McrA